GADALRPVSVSLIRARYVAGIVGDVLCVLMIAGAITSASLTGIWWLAALGALPLVILLQHLLLTPRRVRAIGYLDAEDDVTIASGVMFRSVHHPLRTGAVGEDRRGTGGPTLRPGQAHGEHRQRRLDRRAARTAQSGGGAAACPADRPRHRDHGGAVSAR